MHLDPESRGPLFSEDAIPRVSIGMPVFNGEKSVAKVLDSLLAQTFKDFELIISDNCSTDGTEKICRRYAENDSRIRYVRQPENRGASANFRFVLNEAQGEYFMWAAHDDVRSNDFLEVNYEFLSRNPDFVASTSPVRFSGEEFNSEIMGDRTLDNGSTEERVVRFFGYWHKNGRYYSLIRRRMLLLNKTLKRQDYFGSDWAVVLELICLGKLNRSEHGEIILGHGGVSNVSTIFKTYRKGLTSWLFPFKEFSLFTLALSRSFTLRNRIKIMKELTRLNHTAAILQFRQLKHELLNRKTTP